MNPLLFNHLPKPKPEEIHEITPPKKMRLASPERVSPLKERFTPPRLPAMAAKVSPPTAEEASSNLTPSPARPMIGAVFNNPREVLLKVSGSDDEDCPRDLSRGRESKSPLRVERSSSEQGSEGEQPLDLSCGWKKNQIIEEER